MKPSSAGNFSESSRAAARESRSPLIINFVSGEIFSRRARSSGISSKWAGTFDISFLVRRWTVKAAGDSFKRVESQFLYSSRKEKPRRVLTETGRPFEFSFAFLKHSTARSGVFIMAAPPPARLTFLSGQPKFKSIPAKPRSFRLLARAEKCSGFLPQIWAIIGGSEGAIFRRERAFSLPFSFAKEETFVNSVKKRSGRAARATTWRKTASVTPSIGARQKKGFGRVSQIFFIYIIYIIAFFMIE